MATYEVSETVACYVTWTKVIEADSPEDALCKLHDGECESEPKMSVGDAIDYLDTREQAILVPSTSRLTAAACVRFCRAQSRAIGWTGR